MMLGGGAGLAKNTYDTYDQHFKFLLILDKGRRVIKFQMRVIKFPIFPKFKLVYIIQRECVGRPVNFAIGSLN